MDQKKIIRIWHRFENLYQLRMKSHAEFEFNSDLMKESQSRDVTIENLIQRNKDLVVQNDKLNVKKGFKILFIKKLPHSLWMFQHRNPSKCFEAAKMINDLGIELAKVRSWTTRDP